MADPWPTQLRLTDEGRVLTITFDSGEEFALSSRALRLATQSAEAKRLSPEERAAQIGDRPVRILELEAIGNYAIRPTFDDGHATGIYTWNYLAELGRASKRAMAAERVPCSTEPEGGADGAAGRLDVRRDS